MGNCIKKNKIVPLESIANNECRESGHPKSHIHQHECKETGDSNERDKKMRPKLLRKKTPSKIIKTSTLYNFENQ